MNREHDGILDGSNPGADARLMRDVANAPSLQAKSLSSRHGTDGVDNPEPVGGTESACGLCDICGRTGDVQTVVFGHRTGQVVCDACAAKHCGGCRLAPCGDSLISPDEHAAKAEMEAATMSDGLEEDAGRKSLDESMGYDAAAIREMDDQARRCGEATAAKMGGVCGCPASAAARRVAAVSATLEDARDRQKVAESCSSAWHRCYHEMQIAQIDLDAALSALRKTVAS